MKKNNNISGFKTPQNYFDDFEERLFQRIEEEQFPKSSGFKVPDGYFENLDEQILKSVTQNNSTEKKKVISLIPKKYFGYAAAIAACLLVAIQVFTFQDENPNIESIQISMLDKYIEDGYLNINLYELTNYFEDSDISGLNIDFELIPEGVLESYIIENMDGTTLINEGFNPFE